jgi:hypothetical protein
VEGHVPRSAAPQWRKRKDPVLDHYVLASIEQAGGHGKHDSNGHYATLVIRDLADRAEAEEYVRALNRAALHLHRYGQADVGMSAKIERDGEKHLVRFRAVDKTHARNYMLKKYGPDRSKWPYDPRRRDVRTPRVEETRI